MPINVFSTTDHYTLAFLFNDSIYCFYSILYNYFNYYHLLLGIILIIFLEELTLKIYNITL